MYGYASGPIRVTPAAILGRIPQESVYQLALGYQPKAYQYICSPLRDDPNPGALFKWANGILYFVDFADPKHVSRDCFQFIMDHFSLSFPQALDFIADRMGLNLGLPNELPIIYDTTGLGTKKSSTHSRPCPIRGVKKEGHDIVFMPKPFENADRLFWFNRYGITRCNLQEDNVFTAVWYKFYSQRQKRIVLIRPSDLCYTYGGFSSGHLKVYRPFADRKLKWLSNCNENDIWGIDALPPTGHTLVIQKAYKDYRVIKNEGISTIGFQNEGCVPSESILANLASRFERIVVWYDNDEPGAKAAMKIAGIINALTTQDKARPMWLPPHLTREHIKDASDLRHRHQDSGLRTFLKEQLVYGGDSSSNTPLLGAGLRTTVSA